jgi:hypothetical protein
MLIESLGYMGVWGEDNVIDTCYVALAEEICQQLHSINAAEQIDDRHYRIYPDRIEEAWERVYMVSRDEETLALFGEDHFEEAEILADRRCGEIGYMYLDSQMDQMNLFSPKPYMVRMNKANGEVISVYERGDPLKDGKAEIIQNGSLRKLFITVIARCQTGAKRLARRRYWELSEELPK